MDTSEFNSGFFITIVGIATTFFGVLTLYCLRSKCKKCVLCWGFINIDRDTDNEIKEDILMMEHGMNPYENKSPS
jgi:hypothetical protein